MQKGQKKARIKSPLFMWPETDYEVVVIVFAAVKSTHGNTTRHAPIPINHQPVDA